MRIGVDLIDINYFPSFINGKEKSFFLYNFTFREISFAKKQRNPDLEFARLFSIKESLIKADNSIRDKNFNKIELISTDNKVNYENYQISTSVEKNIIMSFVMSSVTPHTYT